MGVGCRRVPGGRLDTRSTPRGIPMAVDKSTLEAKTREGAGKGAARKLRGQGLVPAVVYGKHLEKPLQVAVDPKSIRQAINTPHKFNTLITLKLDGTSRQVMLK